MKVKTALGSVKKMFFSGSHWILRVTDEQTSVTRKLKLCCRGNLVSSCQWRSRADKKGTRDDYLGLMNRQDLSTETDNVKQ